MDVFKITISTVLGLSVSVLVMSVLFSITMGAMSILAYILIGSIVGLISGLAVYGLLSRIA